ncbi:MULTISPECIES: sensor histidine kinase [Thermodesulfovibrio]|jgi:two-component system sensor histidine kinase LytS|uniref:sensor histidine kinase n=1 Tax=Thermodesulfovibrio TaxID=28261 RepID=UPI00262B9928|nr:sensor histidine kinase [Thermodesulfovibrio sp.]
MDALELTLILLQRLSIIATVAFILSRMPALGRVLSRKPSLKDKIILTFVCGGLGILGTFGAVEIHGALANSRVVGVMVGGLLAGPFVGAGAGLIAGVHRYFVGGFTAFACGLSAVVEGFLGGVILRYWKKGLIPWHIALLAGLSGEIIQMIIILIFAKPFSDALELVKIIAIPMITVNSIGVAIFMSIIKSAIEHQERIAANQARATLKITNLILPHLRKGLNEQSAKNIAEIILNSIGVAAVAITNRKYILAHVGLGADHHRVGHPLQTKATINAIISGEIQIANKKQEIGCSNFKCKLSSAIIVPLKKRKEVIGTLKLYYEKENSITPVDIEVARGLAHIFSTQLEIADFEAMARLKTEAELKSLQAQIHPHFIFNALNTITSLIRIDPLQARKLLNNLAIFLRYSLKREREIPLREELSYVEAYLSIEQARFKNRLNVIYSIQPDIDLEILIPPFTIQPLVENAIKHGLKPKITGGEIWIKIYREAFHTVISVEDNGVGILNNTNTHKPNGTGLGLYLVNERLKRFYGDESILRIESFTGTGTRVSFKIPNRAILTDAIYSRNN